MEHLRLIEVVADVAQLLAMLGALATVLVGAKRLGVFEGTILAEVRNTKEVSTEAFARIEGFYKALDQKVDSHAERIAAVETRLET